MRRGTCPVELINLPEGFALLTRKHELPMKN